MENVAGGKGLALQRLFSYNSSYFFRNSDDHKISVLNDGGLKLGHFDISVLLFPCLAFLNL